MAEITHARAGAMAPVAVTSEEATYSKVAWRLLPFLFLCYVFSYLDRVNVGFAKLQMLNDLKLSETVYGLGAGIFFIGYFLFEVPSNLIMYRVGARIWIARIMVTWGILASAMMFVRGPFSFYLLRFFLGAAEAGFIPGILLYLTYWFPAKRRGKVMAIFLTGIPISGVIGGPLSGWILHQFAGASGLPGWKWLFLLEGIPSLLAGVVAFFYLTDGIRAARWVSEPEKRLLESHVEAEKGAKQHHSMKDAFGEPKVWLLAITYALFLMGLYGVSFWLPSLIKAAGVKDPLNVGLLTAIPYTVATVAMIATSYSSDRTRERRWHLAIAGFCGAVGLLGSVAFAGNTVLAIAALSVAAAGICTTVSQFWNLPGSFLSGVAAAAGIAFVNSVGNVSGFIAPYMVGYVKDLTKSTDAALIVIAACIFLAGLLVFRLPAKLVNK
ncbi:MAG TPA: MFS transporter [Myxococcales bacterium]